MTRYFEIEFNFHPASEPAAFDSFLDCVLDELDRNGRQADVTASLAGATACFTVEVPSLSDEALIATLSDLRTALHAANCATPGWPSHNEVTSTRGISSHELAPA